MTVRHRTIQRLSSTLSTGENQSSSGSRDLWQAWAIQGPSVSRCERPVPDRPTSCAAATSAPWQCVSVSPGCALPGVGSMSVVTKFLAVLSDRGLSGVGSRSVVAKFGSTALNDRGLSGDGSTSVVAKLAVSRPGAVKSVSVAGAWLLCTWVPIGWARVACGHLLAPRFANFIAFGRPNGSY